MLSERAVPLQRTHGARSPAGRRVHQRALSLVELMVGIAVGLFVVAGATVAVSNQLNDNRRLMLETQIQQDLRAASDLITKDLRRAGYWGSAQDGIWRAGAGAADHNPYTDLQGPRASAPASSVQFFYSRGTENGALDDATEHSGFRLSGGALQMYTGGAWQALTDSATLRITEFTVALRSQDIALTCPAACAPGAPACPPKQTVRDVTVQIDGNAVSDASVRRSARSHVRLRNDVITGVCPV